MNKKLYNKWINALNSGEYIPGRKFLRVNEKGKYKHCCLGVLAELHPSTIWQDMPDEISDIPMSLCIYDHTCSKFFLPSKLKKEVNFASSNGKFDVNELSTELIEQIKEQTWLSINIPEISLSVINDNAKPDINIFPLIARILHEQPPSLFKQSRIRKILNWIRNPSASSQLHQTLIPN